jgi:hypothetical protein
LLGDVLPQNVPESAPFEDRTPHSSSHACRRLPRRSRGSTPTGKPCGSSSALAEIFAIAKRGTATLVLSVLAGRKNPPRPTFHVRLVVPASVASRRGATGLASRRLATPTRWRPDHLPVPLVGALCRLRRHSANITSRRILLVSPASHLLAHVTAYIDLACLSVHCIGHL